MRVRVISRLRAVEAALALAESAAKGVELVAVVGAVWAGRLLGSVTRETGSAGQPCTAASLLSFVLAETAPALLHLSSRLVGGRA